ncbi:MAG: isoprenylcysteine carboxylmethyltransferase family protein [Candidatus Roizmanbacteria bacterium]
MNTFSFTIIFLAIGSSVTAYVWATTSGSLRKHTRSIFTGAVLIQWFAVMLHLFSGFIFPLPMELDVPVRSLGLTLFTVGVFLAVWAKYTMQNRWGIPGQHDAKSQNELVTSGPFSYTRNPIYVGAILMNFGIAIALKSAFVFIIFVIYNYFYTQVLIEEKLLKKIFGKSFVEYCKKVPRFI